jgi:hypothetical protein
LRCAQLNLNRVVFSLNQRLRTNLAIEIRADRTSGGCCVDPLRPPGLPECGNLNNSAFREGNVWITGAASVCPDRQEIFAKPPS